MSDQDFFFDEDEATAEKPEPARTQAKAPTRPRPSAPATAGVAQQSVTMTVAGLIGVVMLLIGIIVGILIPTGGSQSVSPATAPVPGGSQAAPLSPEQLEGGIPPGHPDIGGMGGNDATPGADEPSAGEPEADGDTSETDPEAPGTEEDVQ